MVGVCHGYSLVEASSGHWICQLYHLICGSLAFTGGKGGALSGQKFLFTIYSFTTPDLPEFHLLLLLSLSQKAFLLFPVLGCVNAKSVDVLQLKESSQAPQAPSKTNVLGAEGTLGPQLCFESLAVTFPNIHGVHLQSFTCELGGYQWPVIAQCVEWVDATRKVVCLAAALLSGTCLHR